MYIYIHSTLCLSSLRCLFRRFLFLVRDPLLASVQLFANGIKRPHPNILHNSVSGGGQMPTSLLTLVIGM